MANNNRSNRLLTFFVLYSLFLVLWWQFVGSRGTSKPTPVTSIQEQAQKLETEAKDPNASLANRLTRYREAIGKHQEIYHQGGHNQAAINARYQELRLLEEMGFGLDLSACAVTGGQEGLAYVSPKSGRAVSREGAGEWADRLLPLPGILGGAGDNRGHGLAEGLAITGHFLTARIAGELVGRAVPAARQRLVDRLTRGQPKNGY